MRIGLTVALVLCCCRARHAPAVTTTDDPPPLPRPEVVRAQGAWILLAEDDAILWTDVGGGPVRRTPLPSGADETMTSLRVREMVKHRGVYWLVSDDAVLTMAAGAKPTVIASALNLPGELEVRGDVVCWSLADDPSDARARATWCSAGDGKTPVRAPPSPSPRPIAARGADSYVIEHNTIVRQRGAERTAMFEPKGLLRCAVAVGDDFWLAYGAHEPGDIWGHGPMHSTLYRVPIAGGAPVAVASGFDDCLSIASNRDAIWIGSYQTLARFRR